LDEGDGGGFVRSVRRSNDEVAQREPVVFSELRGVLVHVVGSVRGERRNDLLLVLLQDSKDGQGKWIQDDLGWRGLDERDETCRALRPSSQSSEEVGENRDLLSVSRKGTSVRSRRKQGRRSLTYQGDRRFCWMSVKRRSRVVESSRLK